MKIATWNVNSIRARHDHLIGWLQRYQPDVVCLQETKVVDDLFPVMDLEAIGYSSAFAGEKTYNGVALVSRYPLNDVQVEFPLADNEEHRLISAVVRGVRIFSAYVPNGRDPASEHFQTKLRWLAALPGVVLNPARRGELGTAVLGDFNVAPEPRDVHDVAAMEGRLLFLPEERAAFARLLAAGLVDAFRACRPEGGLFSWWDYRQGAFRRNLGLRIDHVCITPDLVDRLVGAEIDVSERRKPSPSDHTPVIVELNLD